MHLYIKSNGISIQISNITLHQGYMPMVGYSTSQEYGCQQSLQLEPAVWFKALVLDVLCVDCDSRSISWDSLGENRSTDNSDSISSVGGSFSIFRQKRYLSEAMSGDDEYLSYNTDLDEVFAVVPCLLEAFCDGKMKQKEFHDDIMRLLHCNILPCIVLYDDDLERLGHVLGMQATYIEDINEKITRAGQKLESVLQALQAQRRKYTADLAEQKYSGFPHDLVVQLTQDLDTDCQSATVELDSSQEEVNRLKQLIKDGCAESLCEKNNYILQLAEKRKRRDKMFEDYQQLLLARENLHELKTTTATKKQKKRKQRNDKKQALYDIYMAMTREVDECNARIQLLTDIKVLMLSVKEAVRSAIDDLTVSSETCGVEVDRTCSRKATDVLTGSGNVAWQSYQEQIAQLLSKRGHRVASRHQQFCSQLLQRCSDVRNDKNGAFHNKLSHRRRAEKESGQTTQNMTLDEQRRFLSLNAKPSSNSVEKPVKKSASEVNAKCIRKATFVSYVDSRNQSPVIENHSIESSEEISSVLLEDIKSSRDKDWVMVSRDELDDQDSSSQVEPADNFSGTSTVVGADDNLSATVSQISLSTVTTGYLTESPTEDIKQWISSHFDAICAELQQDIGLSGTSMFRKIWICYESHFYDRVMDDLMFLYESRYQPVNQLLAEYSNTLSATDLSLDDSVFCVFLQASEASRMSETVRSVASMAVVDRLTSAVDVLAGKLRGKANDEKSFGKSSSDCVSVVEPHPAIVDGSQMNGVAQQSGAPTHQPSNVKNASSDLTSASSDNSSLPYHRFLSEPAYSPKRISITITRPVSCVLVYDRLVRQSDPNSNMSGDHAPVKTRCCQSFPGESPNGTINFSQDVVRGCVPAPSLESRKNKKPSPLKEPLRAVLHEKYREQFVCIHQLFDQSLSEKLPVDKLQCLSKCLRKISDLVSRFYADVFGSEVGACSDELIDVLVIVLCSYNELKLAKLYCQLMLLTDIIAPFFNTGPYSFTLVQFMASFQFLQERAVMKHNKSTKADDDAM